MSIINTDVNFFSETQPEELNLFTLPPTQTAVERTYIQEVRPISQLSENSPIDFHLSGANGLEYVDLKNSTLFVKCKIKKTDGTSLTKDENCVPVNLFLQSLWSQVDVSLQGKLINSTTNNYPYRAMIQILTESSLVEDANKLQSQLFYKDTQGQMDATGSADGNLGLFNRYVLTSQSKSVDMEGPLYHDIFQMKRYILNQVDIQVRLYRSKSTFCLMSKSENTEYTVFLEDVVLKVMKVCVNPGIIWGHNEALSTTPSKYPYIRTEIKMMAIPSGQSTFIWDNIFQSTRPLRVYVGFVCSDAVSGNLKKNPFNFKHYHLNQINLFCDGVSYGNGGPMKLSFEKKSGQSVMPMFMNLLRTDGKWTGSGGGNITRSELDGGYALYAFSLEPMFEGFENNFKYLNLQKRGNLRLEVQFGSPLSETVTCVLYAKFPGYFEIDKTRNVIL